MAYYVFLDTNIYEESNFNFGNGKFTKLKELAEEDNVTLLYNEVVYGEVKQHIESHIKEAVTAYNTAIKNRGFAPFRNEAAYLELLNEQELVDKQWQAWDDYLQSCSAIKIPTKNVDVDLILSNYFKGVLPFESKKPTEFKDAIMIESIKEYFYILRDNEMADSIYVVAADNGVRKSFRNDKNIIPFNSLNKFVNYIVLHTEFLAVAVNNEIRKGLFDNYIKENIVDDVYVANCDVEDCFDSFDIIDVEYMGYTIGYIDITENSLAEVALEIYARICVDFIERDEENSFYDREDGAYLWEEFAEYQETHEVSFEAILNLGIDGLDEKEIREKINKTDILLEGVDEAMLNITLEPEMLFIPKGTIISMDRRTLVQKEIVMKTIEAREEEEEYAGDKSYTICPDCGKAISHQNDGGNGFCIECAVQH